MATLEQGYSTAFEDLLKKKPITPTSPYSKRRSISPMAEAGVKIRTLVDNFKENARYRLSIRMKKESGQPDRFRPFPFTNPSEKELPTYNDVLHEEIQRKYEEELDKRSNSEPQGQVMFPPKELFPQFLDTLPDDRFNHATLSPEENMSAYLSALTSTLCLLRAGLSKTDGDTLLNKLQEVFDIQDEEQESWFNHITQNGEFNDNIQCRVVSVGYLVEKHRRDDIYCRVGISHIDPDSISPKTHITELISENHWESTSSISLARSGVGFDETKTLPLPKTKLFFFLELWSGSEFALPSQSRYSPRMRDSFRQNSHMPLFNESANYYSSSKSDRISPNLYESMSLPRNVPSRPAPESEDSVRMIVGCFPARFMRIPGIHGLRRTPSPRSKSTGDVFIGRMYIDAQKITTECAGGAVQSYALFSRSGKHMRGTIQLQLRLVSRCILPNELLTQNSPTFDVTMPLALEPLELHRNVQVALAKYEIENSNARIWDGSFDSYFKALLKQHTFDHELTEVQSAVAILDVLSKVQPSLYCKATTLESHFNKLLVLFGGSDSGLGAGEKKLLRRTLEGLMDYHLHGLALNMLFVVSTEREKSQKVIAEVDNLLEVINKLMKELSIYHYETETKFRLEQKVMHLVTLCFDSCLETYSITTFKFIALVEGIHEYLRKIRDYQTTYDIEGECLRHLYKCIIMHLTECIRRFMTGEAVSRATELETVRQDIYSLYVVVRNIQELRPSFTIITSEDGQNNEILQPFESYIIPWFGDICSKSCDVVRNAIEVDQLVPVDIHVKFSTMVVDIDGILTETYNFLRRFQWARPQAFAKLIERVLHYLHRLVDIFVIQSREKLNRVNSDLPYITNEEIIILENTYKMHEVLETAKEKICKVSTVTEASKCNIDENIKTIHERLDTYIEALISQISKMFSADAKEYLKDILKLPKDNSLIQPMNRWNSFIYTLTQRVATNASPNVLRLIYQMMWDDILEMIIKQLDKKQFKLKGKLQERLDSIMPMMFDYFHREENGLKQEELKTENYANIIYKLIKHH